MEQAINFSQELDTLQHRKQLLQKLVRTALSLENLRQALQASSPSDGASYELPSAYDNLFKELGHKTRNLSDADIALRLKALDQKVQLGLQPILDITEDETALDDRLQDGAEADQLFREIDKFCRMAQTTMALRIMMQRRGVKLPTVRLKVDPKILSQRLASVAQKESHCRQRVVSELAGMQQALQNLLQNPACPQAMQRLLPEALDGLQQNLAHLAAGQNIKDMPVALDIICLDSQGAGEELTDPQEPASASEAQEQEPVPAKAHHSMGFWGKLQTWLNTHWRTHWKDI